MAMPSASEHTPTFWSETTSPLGPLYIATNEQGLCAIKFGRLEPEIKSRFRSQLQRSRETNLSNQVCAQLQEYFSGRQHTFDLPVDLSALTPFQRKVLAVTSRIPWGEVRHYQRVAQEMGRPKSSRPVGQALGRNPIPIVIPCHRVIASDGSLGGYCGKSGLDLKRWLLRHEGVQL
jgi:methylated-DNA-[protein]-cysteine S-methyltransferase